MSRQRVFHNQPTPDGSTKLTPAGNPFRVTDIIVDNTDTQYTYIGKDPVTGEALWAPDEGCFPEDNKEYPAYVENGVVVWKKKITGTLDSTLTKIAHGITESFLCVKITGYMNEIATRQRELTYFGTTSSFVSVFRDGANITFPCSSGFVSKTVDVNIFYIKE